MSFLSMVPGVSVRCCLLVLCAGKAWAATELRCDVSYAGGTQTVVAQPVQDPYAVPAVDVHGRFRFKAVMVGVGDRIERINLYVQQKTPTQPVILQQAKYLPPFHWPGDGPPLALTGQQRLYASPVERELIYSCALHRSRP